MTRSETEVEAIHWVRTLSSSPDPLNTDERYHTAQLMESVLRELARVRHALKENDELLFYILTNSLGGWAGRTEDEIRKWRSRRKQP